MHMASALVAPAVAVTMYAASGSGVIYSAKKVRLEQTENSRLPLVGVLGAVVFAAQMVNFSIPGTGSSGHITGGFLLAALLGPHAGFLTMAGILLLQSLFFADGGILALGCNVWNMAFYSCFFGYYCIYKPLMSGKKKSRSRLVAAAVLGNIISLQLGAFSVTLQTLASGITELPFGAFLTSMQPVHLAIGLVEGIICAAVLLCFYEDNKGIETENEKIFSKRTVAILGLTALFIGGGISLLASQNPDGLEWAVEKTAGSKEIETTGMIYEAEQRIQETLAIMPDYSLDIGAVNETLAASIAGIAGSAITAVALYLTFKKLSLQ